MFFVAIKNAWRKGDCFEMAISILTLLKDLQSFGILWMIFESFLSEMGMLEWLMLVTQVCASLTATLSTGGLALAAQLAGMTLSLKSLIDLIDDVS